MQIPCVYIPGPAPAVSVANRYCQRKLIGVEKKWHELKGVSFALCRWYFIWVLVRYVPVRFVPVWYDPVRSILTSLSPCTLYPRSVGFVPSLKDTLSPVFVMSLNLSIARIFGPSPIYSWRNINWPLKKKLCKNQTNKVIKWNKLSIADLMFSLEHFLQYKKIEIILASQPGSRMELTQKTATKNLAPPSL
jgi:hypothetical protein